MARLISSDMMKRFTLPLLLFAAASGALFADDATHRFELKATAGLSRNAPIWVTLPDALKSANSIRLRLEAADTLIPTQPVNDGQQIVFLLPIDIAAGHTQVFDVTSTNQLMSSIVKVTQEPDQLSFQIDDSEVLAYHTSIVEPPEGFSELYRRSGHIHPFVTPKGKVVTDGFPIDHMHQHGIFAAWTKTFFEGKRVDFWNQKAGTGTVLHKEVLSLTSGPVYASAKVRLIHKVLQENPHPVLEETWTIRLYNDHDVHIFDIDSVQKCVADSPLTIAEYHYGGFAFRGSAEWEDKESHSIITNETTDRKIGNHTRPNWVSIFGNVQGEICGGAMFSHPTNFRSPQPVRLHPSMPYFVYAPSVLGEFKLEPGVHYKTRNRYISFDGEPKSELLDQLWTNYSQSPEIVWQEVE